MNSMISERTREMLTWSLPLVRQHKDALIDRVELNLRGVDGAVSRRDTEMTAMVLVELLLDQAHGLIGTRMPSRLDGMLAEHRALGIDGRYYSRFGDALTPILSDLLGPNVPRQVPAAWCDAFWTIVRALEAPRRRAVG